MKKFVSMVVALTLIFAMSLSVCAAAPSVSTATKVLGPNGKEVVVNKLSDAAVSDAKDAFAKHLGDSAKEYTAAVAVDIEGQGPGNYTISVPNVKSGAAVIILHKLSDGTYEIIEGTVVNGTVTAYFKSFSPVIIFVKASAVSPKTADASLTTAACVAMLAAAGLAISKKKFA